MFARSFLRTSFEVTVQDVYPFCCNATPVEGDLGLVAWANSALLWPKYFFEPVHTIVKLQARINFARN